MNRRELLDYCGLFADALPEALLKFTDLPFLLVQVLDKSSSTFLHLTESALESDSIRGTVGSSCPTVLSSKFSPLVLRMPHVVSNKLVQCYFPVLLQHVVRDILDEAHQSFNVFNENIISSDQHFFLLIFLFNLSFV